MGDVISIRTGQSLASTDFRQAEASELRNCISEHRVEFRSGENKRVADRLNERIDRHATALGRTVTSVCRHIWPDEDNPAKRRYELRSVKKAAKLMEYVGKVAQAVKTDADDLLLDVFRGTRFDEAVTTRMMGKGGGPDLEQCWRILSDTLQKLVFEAARAEGLKEHQRRSQVLQGRYDLATGAISAAQGPMLYGPLANSSIFHEEYPPIPSIVLFREPKSDTVECPLILEATGRALHVAVTVIREVRLAIGPADDVDEPSALFEFRSVLDLRSSKGDVRVLRPWHDLADAPVIVEIDGAWHPAKLVLPKEPIADPHFMEQFANWPVQRFPAQLEPPLQFEHHDIVWRPVTPTTCSDLLLRDCDVTVEWLSSFNEAPTACPPGSLAQRLELALWDSTPDGLTSRLRDEARRISELGRSWHAERSGLAEAAHRKLRDSWETWS